MAATSVELTAQTEVPVRVVDQSDGSGVYGAKIADATGAPIAITGVDGSALLPMNEAAELWVDALGYESNSFVLDPERATVLIIQLTPSPIELEGLVVSGMRFSQRLETRRNSVWDWSDVLTETVLLNAPDPTLEDLLRSRFAIEFRDYTDFGCRVVKRLGHTQVAHFYIDERPVRAAMFEQLSPKSIGMLEAFGVGPIAGDLRIFAYTRDYVSEMSERNAPPTPLETTPTLC